ncbi:hypothetical protein SEET0821_20851 [Salmonella enterica subsp. enterica serovar Tennessee str. TXSC_TXSC08-21]|nr:hypothetical protein SEET0821_20851 [Salmonella enterica subsp. enterica serovar Tennessee str. TXSC_TXSC08-21]
MFQRTYQAVKRRHMPGVQMNSSARHVALMAGDIDAGRGVNP